MIQCKCIQKFRDAQGKIYGYRLQDLNGQTKDVTPKNLKIAITNNQVSVINLRLTSDNRLVDSKSKKLQTLSLGEPPTIKKSCSEKEYEWLLEISETLFGMIECGEAEYCGTENFDEFMSDSLEAIDSKSLAFYLLDCCKDEYYNDWDGDIEDFVSEWGLTYIVYGNLATSTVWLYLGSCTFEMSEFKVEMVVKNKKDVSILAQKAKELYNKYSNLNKRYKSELKKEYIDNLRKEKEKRRLGVKNTNDISSFFKID